MGSPLQEIYHAGPLLSYVYCILTWAHCTCIHKKPKRRGRIVIVALILGFEVLRRVEVWATVLARRASPRRALTTVTTTAATS